MEIFEKLKAKWLSEELDVHPGQDERAIVQCFEKFGFKPKKDLVALYKTLDGKDCMDEEYFRLWSLKEICEENRSEHDQERTEEYGVLFGDYCVNCWCFRVNNKGAVFVDYFTEGEVPQLRANSITEFFLIMEKHPDEVLV